MTEDSSHITMRCILTFWGTLGASAGVSVLNVTRAAQAKADHSCQEVNRKKKKKRTGYITVKST